MISTQLPRPERKKPSSAEKKRALRLLADFMRRAVLTHYLPDGSERSYHKAALLRVAHVIQQHHGNLQGLFDFLEESFSSAEEISMNNLEILGLPPEFLEGL